MTNSLVKIAYKSNEISPFRGSIAACVKVLDGIHGDVSVNTTPKKTEGLKEGRKVRKEKQLMFFIFAEFKGMKEMREAT